MKRIRIYILLIASVFSISGCNKVAKSLEEIDKDIAALKESDEALYRDMSDQITALEVSLLKKIEETKNRLGGDIDAAMADLMELLSYKIEGLQEHLDSELLARKKACDASLLEIRSYVDLTRSRCDAALAASQLYMSEAIEKGDAQLEEQMRSISGKITELDATSENVGRNVAMWKSRLNAIQGSGMYDAMDAIDAALQELDSFDIQAEMDKMEARLKQFAAIRMEELTNDEMRDIKAMMEQMQEWLYEADDMADDCQSTTQEMNNLLDDWQSNADDIYSTLESAADDILAAFEDIYGELDSAQASAEELISMIESAIDDIYEVADQAADYEDLALSMADELQGLYDTICDRVDDVRDMQSDAFQTALILLDAVGEWQNNHPWLFE